MATSNRSTPQPAPVIHPCRCKAYNRGQCYNCLNGAHSLCQGNPKCRRKPAARIGLTIVIH